MKQPSKYIADSALAARFGTSRNTIWRWAAENGDFPKPVKLSPRCTRWLLADVEAWEQSRKQSAQRAA